MNISYNNFDMLEVGYGINLRRLTTFAADIYGNDECKKFWPHVLDKNKFDPVDDQLAARMHKANPSAPSDTSAHGRSAKTKS